MLEVSRSGFEKLLLVAICTRYNDAPSKGFHVRVGELDTFKQFGEYRTGVIALMTAL